MIIFSKFIVSMELLANAKLVQLMMTIALLLGAWRYDFVTTTEVVLLHEKMLWQTEYHKPLVDKNIIREMQRDIVIRNDQLNLLYDHL